MAGDWVIKWTRQYFAMLATPVGTRDILLGHQLWMTTRVAMTSAVYLAVIAAFGGVDSPYGILALPAAVLLGAAFTTPFAAYAATRDNDAAFVPVNRFIVIPMFLFSGTFFPVSQLPRALEWLAYATPLWHGVELCRDVHARRRRLAESPRSQRVPDALRGDRFPVRRAHLRAEAASDIDRVCRQPGRLLFERNLMVYRRAWLVIFSGVFEPLFYLFSLGIGLGHFVGKVPGPDGQLISYASYVAPALLASAAMNGAIYDATNVFWKLKYIKTYDAVLSTPIGPADIAVGETAWALFRGFLYAISFMAVAGVLGLIESGWGVLALPGAVLIGFAFAGIGVAATTFMRTWQDFELIALVQLPMFLFSATFFPISTYPPAAQWIVRCSPLYHAIELLRALTLGTVGWAQLVNVAYLAALGSGRSLRRPAPPRQAPPEVDHCYPVRRPQPRLSAYFRRIAGTDDNGGEMGLTKEVKQEIVQHHGASKEDTGSTKVQVALLTKRINDLTEHLRAHPKDHYSRRGLLKLVGRRRRFLTYLQKHDLEGYRALIKELGLRR